MLDLARHGGWILAKPGLTGTFGGLRFRFRAPSPLGDFLQVRVDSERSDVFPRVMISPGHRKDLPEGWSEVFLSMDELNPAFAPFDRVIVRAAATLPAPTWVEFDDVGLTAADASLLARAEAQAQRPAVPTGLEVDCTAPAKPISPLIYGIAYSPRHEDRGSHQWRLGATTRRWGGNPSSRYNWELGNAWNAGADYYFRNLDYAGGTTPAWSRFLEVNAERRVTSALTVPMLGWVARDTTSYSFPVELFGPQQATDPDLVNAGNGTTRDGAALEPPPPARTSVPASPEFIERWVRAIASQSGQKVGLYILDNEPMLWSDTHRDVHPEPTSADELLRKTLGFSAAIRRADPNAQIAGPAEWGWTGYFYSAVDVKAGTFARPDRRAHGDLPLVAWYLQSLKAHEAATGQRTIDVLDLHFYPQGKGIGLGEKGRTDEETSARRIRSTRALWDPSYRDESWIAEPVRLIPRMREWVDTWYPGLKLAVGEYNFGAEGHASGGLAVAEALGRFGQQGLDMAWYWTYPPEGSPAAFAFRAYRDYDGQGARFQDWALPARASEGTSLFASRDAAGRRMVLVALNLSSREVREGELLLRGCAAIERERIFTWTSASHGFAHQRDLSGRTLRLPPWSMTVIELDLAARRERP